MDVTPTSLDNGMRGTPGEKLSPGSALGAVGNALESYRASVNSAGSQEPLCPVCCMCILTGKYRQMWKRIGLSEYAQNVQQEDDREIFVHSTKTVNKK